MMLIYVNLCLLNGRGEHIFQEWYGHLRETHSTYTVLCTLTASAPQNTIVKDLQLKDIFIQGTLYELLDCVIICCRGLDECTTNYQLFQLLIL